MIFMFACKVTKWRSENDNTVTDMHLFYGITYSQHSCVNKLQGTWYLFRFKALINTQIQAANDTGRLLF